MRRAGTSVNQVAELNSTQFFRYFAVISDIPCGSHHEQAVSDHLVKFAHDRGL